MHPPPIAALSTMAFPQISNPRCKLQLDLPYNWCHVSCQLAILVCLPLAMLFLLGQTHRGWVWETAYNITFVFHFGSRLCKLYMRAHIEATHIIYNLISFYKSPGMAIKLDEWSIWLLKQFIFVTAFTVYIWLVHQDPGTQIHNGKGSLPDLPSACLSWKNSALQRERSGLETIIGQRLVTLRPVLLRVGTCPHTMWC